MESFLPSEIARLVLGYLEDSRCDEAYETFLKTSSLLAECLKMREEGRKFRTQVMGLNLVDILYEYSAIFSLVQERLKKVDPETASSLKNSGSLLDKITFLLNATSSGQTMLFSITLPPGKSPSTAHVRKRLRSTMNEKKKDMRKDIRSHINEFSPIIELDENIAKPSTLETTSLCSLPGNVNASSDRTDNLEILRTPKRKNNNLNSTRRSRANSEIPENSEENLDITALTQALLDNHELHEKIAENINKVIRTPELTACTTQDLCGAQNLTLPETNTTLSNTFSLELDNAIKKIVEQTESDPVFENFLQDVVFPMDETSDDGEDRGISDTSTPCQSTPETIKKPSLKQRLRSAKKQTDSSSTDVTPAKIEHQNAVAIESIISIQNNPKEPEPSTSGLQKSSNNEINESTKQESQLKISKSGSINTINAQPLTVQTSTTKSVETVTLPQSVSSVTPVTYHPTPQDNRLVILSSKMTDAGSVFTVQPAQLQTTSFTDDILSMPTVIISDERNPSNNYLIPQKVFPSVSSVVAVDQPLIHPKPQPIIHHVSQPKPKFILPHPIINTNINNMSSETITYTLNVQPLLQTSVSKTRPVESIHSTSKTMVKTTAKSVPIIPTDSDKKVDQTDQQKVVTPEKVDKKDEFSLSTPKTGRSHIRALDFSTPPKGSSIKKSLTSPKARNKSTKTPRRSRSSLFTSPLNVPIATRSPFEKLKGEWDGSELIFAPSNSKKSMSSPTINTSDENKNESQPAKRRRVLSMNQISDTPLVIDESESNIPVKIETKKEMPTKPKSKYSSWDQDLRALIASDPEQGKPKKKTPVKKVYRKRVKSAEQKNKDIGNKTEEDGKAIEAALVNEEVKEPAKKNIRKPNVNKKKSVGLENKSIKSKPPLKRKRQIKAKKPVHKTELIVKAETEIKVEDTLVKDDPVEETKTPKDDPVEDIKTLKEDPAEDINPIVDNLAEDVNQQREPEGMRNMTPRVHKKCNMGSSTKKTNSNLDDVTEEGKTVTVLSPSKMNANKRIFVEQDKPEVKNPQNNKNEHPVDTSEIISKADLLKASTSNVMKVKRNLTPMLETPLKDESQLLPITPRLLTPFGSEASFSNLIKQNCGSIDLSTLMTPNFPMTPCFPITPKMHSGDTHSSYASRPTDYSTSSSYYQPSDSEQTKKIDQVLIKEAMEIESASLKKPICTSTPDKNASTLPNQELSIPPKDTMPNSTGDTIKLKDSALQKPEESMNSSKSSDSNRTDLHSTVTSTSSFESSISKETIQIDKDSNTTVIHITSGKLKRGGKHMAMLKKLMKPDDIDSESNISESPESVKNVIVSKKETIILTTEKVEQKEENHTPIEKYIQPVVSVNKSKIKVNKSKPQSKESEIAGTSKKNSNVTKAHCPILQELEMKRQRIIQELKKEDAKTKSKPQAERKPRSRRNVETTTRVTRSKSSTRKRDIKEDNQKSTKTEKKNPPGRPKSTTLKRNSNIKDGATRLKKNINTNKRHKETMKALLFSPDTSLDSNDYSFCKEKGLGAVPEDEVVSLYMSPDEEIGVPTNNEDDIVKGLKERGIHLIPKPKAPIKDEDNPNIINSETLNLIVSEEKSSTNQSTDAEESIPEDKIKNKIKIKSDICLDESAKIDVSKILTQRRVSGDAILEKPIKKVKEKSKFQTNENVITENKEQELIAQKDTKITEEETTKELLKDKTDNLLKNQLDKSKEIKLNTAIVPVNEIDEDLFHVKIVTEDSPECIKVVHDETKIITKTIKDYDLSVLERKFSANVFIEELNGEQDRVLSVTPFINLASFSKKVPRVVLKPLEVLYNDIVDESSGDTLFSDESFKPKSRQAKIVKSQTKSKIVLEKDPRIKPTSRSKVASPKLTKKLISLEQYKSKQKQELRDSQDKILSENNDDSDKMVFNKEDDDLMTFAVTESLSESKSKKRKAEPDSSKIIEKRIKSEDTEPSDKLLKSLDVEEFLSRIHGVGK